MRWLQAEGKLEGGPIPSHCIQSKEANQWTGGQLHYLQVVHHVGSSRQTFWMSKVNAKGRKTLKKFGLLVRQRRDQKGWTLEEAEEHGFSSWRYLQRLEAGKHNISLLTIVELARLYKIHPAELLKDL